MKQVNTVPFNDTSRMYNDHRTILQAAMIEVAESGWWLMGNRTRDFADEFSKYCGVQFCLPVANGTDALELAIKAVIDEISAGSEVITVANAGGYSSIACRLAGVTPVYADILPETLLIDIESLKRCLSPNVKAVVLTHLFGAVVNVDEVRQELDQLGYNNVKIIEDCAQAHGAKLGNRHVGSLGDIAAFSFYPTKNLGAMGDAGAITTNDESLYLRVKSLQQYGWSSKYKIDVAGGKNSRMDEMQAGILQCLLPHLDGWNQKRAEIYKAYKSSGGKYLSFQNYQDCDYVGHLAVVRTEKRVSFLDHMKNSGVAVDIHYPILDLDQPGWSKMRFRYDEASDLCVSRQMAKQVVSLPCFPTMTSQEIAQISHALIEWNPSQ